MSSVRPFFIFAAAIAAVAATSMFGGGTEPVALAVPAKPEIGAPVPADIMHVVTRPGLYGISDPAPGMQYAVVGDSLVRVEVETGTVRSIIRSNVRPVD